MSTEINANIARLIKGLEAQDERWADLLQQRRLIKALARRGEFPQWRQVYDIFDDIAYQSIDGASVSAAAAIGGSMLMHANNPDSFLYGNVPDVWNEVD